MKSFYCKQPCADEQVRAIIEGRKTLLVEPLSDKDLVNIFGGRADYEDCKIIDNGLIGGVCKYKLGERYWLRESCKICDWLDTGQPIVECRADRKTNIVGDWDDSWDWYLESLWESLSSPENYHIDGKAAERKWRPSTQMPGWASRFIMEVTRVYVKKIQDVTDDECKKIYQASWHNDVVWCWFVEFKGV